MEIFGEMMFKSGESLFFQYESGIPEMFTIYNLLRET